MTDVQPLLDDFCTMMDTLWITELAKAKREKDRKEREKDRKVKEKEMPSGFQQRVQSLLVRDNRTVLYVTEHEHDGVRLPLTFQTLCRLNLLYYGARCVFGHGSSEKTAQTGALAQLRRSNGRPAFVVDELYVKPSKHAEHSADEQRVTDDLNTFYQNLVDLDEHLARRTVDLPYRMVINMHRFLMEYAKVLTEATKEFALEKVPAEMVDDVKDEHSLFG